MYILDTAANRWNSFPSHVYREGHSTLYIGNHNVLVYGGCTNDVTERSEEFHGVEMLIYNTKNHTWSPAPQFGTIPKSRSRHAVCLSTDKSVMFLSGGLKPGKMDPYDDVYCYDISHGEWSPAVCGFVGRFDHEIVHQGDKIWAFGGLNKEMGHTSELTWYDLVTDTTGITRINQLQHTLQKEDTDHMFLQTGDPDYVLDVVVPSWSLERVEPWVGLYDLKNLRYTVVIAPNFKSLLNHSWRVNFVTLEKLFLVGYPLTPTTMDAAYDYELSHMLSFNMTDFCPLINTRNVTTSSSMSSDFARLLEDDRFTDFEIFALASETKSRLLLDTAFSDAPRSPPIKVHKLILCTRWPHFAMMENSGMIESQTGSLFIPEPLSWVKALMEYLYTNDIATKTVDNMTGLLVLSNLYHLKELRDCCISWILSYGFRLKTVLTIWKHSMMAQEEMLAHNASMVIFENWGKIVQTDEFKQMDKEDILLLCGHASRDSSIVVQNTDHSDQRLERRDVTVHRDDGSYQVRIGYNNVRRLTLDEGILSPLSEY